MYKILFGLMFLAGCATQPQGPSYAESVMAAPMPTTEEGRQRDCNKIRSELARQQSSLSLASALPPNPMMMGRLQMQVAENTAALNNRASMVGCNAAFSSVTTQQKSSGFSQQCFDTCKANTTKTADQCFEACNK